MALLRKPNFAPHDKFTKPCCDLRCFGGLCGDQNLPKNIVCGSQNDKYDVCLYHFQTRYARYHLS